MPFQCVWDQICRRIRCSWTTLFHSRCAPSLGAAIMAFCNYAQLKAMACLSHGPLRQLFSTAMQLINALATHSITGTSPRPRPCSQSSTVLRGILLHGCCSLIIHLGLQLAALSLVVQQRVCRHGCGAVQPQRSGTCDRVVVGVAASAISHVCAFAARPAPCAMRLQQLINGMVSDAAVTSTAASPACCPCIRQHDVPNRKCAQAQQRLTQSA